MCRPSVNSVELNQHFLAAVRSYRPNVILVCKGAFLAPAILACAKHETGAVLINYATDDPFNRRVSSRDLIESIPVYDLYACTKRAIMADVAKAGCFPLANVKYVPFGYKPSVHYPEPPETAEQWERFAADAVFIGGCDRRP